MGLQRKPIVCDVSGGGAGQNPNSFRWICACLGNDVHNNVAYTYGKMFTFPYTKILNAGTNDKFTHNAIMGKNVMS